MLHGAFCLLITCLEETLSNFVYISATNDSSAARLDRRRGFWHSDAICLQKHKTASHSVFSPTSTWPCQDKRHRYPFSWNRLLLRPNMETKQYSPWESTPELHLGQTSNHFIAGRDIYTQWPIDAAFGAKRTLRQVGKTANTTVPAGCESRKKKKKSQAYLSFVLHYLTH